MNNQLLSRGWLAREILVYHARHSKHYEARLICNTAILDRMEHLLVGTDWGISELNRQLADDIVTTDMDQPIMLEVDLICLGEQNAIAGLVFLYDQGFDFRPEVYDKFYVAYGLRS